MSEELKKAAAEAAQTVESAAEEAVAVAETAAAEATEAIAETTAETFEADPEEKKGKKARKEKKAKKKLTAGRIILRVILILLAVVIVGIGIAVLSVMSTKREAAKSVPEYAAEYTKTVITEEKDGSIVLKPAAGAADQKTGIIFYVGAEIEPAAYIPLMALLAENGYTCYIPKMPGNVATFKAGEAGSIIDANPGITSWYLAGHSLGGFTAAGYAANNADKLDGMIFLAAYTSTDISGLKLSLLSIYGDTDTVLNKERYEAALAINPADFTEYVIVGGNHAQFGDYGEQPGDTPATISADEQRAQTAAFILAWLKK